MRVDIQQPTITDTMPVTLEHPDGFVHVESGPNGKSRVSVETSKNDLFVPYRACETSYPLNLIQHILDAKGIAYLCDEILRDESSTYVQQSLNLDILSYVEPILFERKRILDFGCGCGASTMTLARMCPSSEIVGLELVQQYVSVCRIRAKYYGYENVQFIESPNAISLPDGLGTFDYIVLSAVFEHLRPEERRSLLPLLWTHLKPAGILFINQTPHRWWPLESHTTSLPLLNYLPDNVALWAARRFCKRVHGEESWETLLRRGIRGASVAEIMSILNRAREKPVLLEPHRLGINDRIDLWYMMSGASRLQLIKRFFWLSFKLLKFTANVAIVPHLALAIRKN